MRPFSFRKHATGLTMLLTAVYAVGLSLLPLPDSTPESVLKWVRPIPDLAAMKPGEAFLAYTWPKALKWYKAQQAPSVIDDPSLQMEAETGAPETGPTDAAPAGGIKEMPTGSELFTHSIADLPVHARNEARELEALGRRIGTTQVDVLEGCRKKDAQGACQEYALDPFFQAIRDNKDGKRKDPARVIHLGNSLIASDHISDMIRSRLEDRYGSAGKGFLFVDRPTRGAGRKVRTGEATDGWDITKITDKAPESERFGYSGVAFSPKDGAQKASFQAGSAASAEVFYLSKPNGGAIGLKADGQLVAEVRTAFARPEVSYAKVPLPSGVKTLELAPLRGDIAVYGLALENGKPGVVLDSIGLPGATAEVYLRASVERWTTQFIRRNPALVLVMLGGNEAHEFNRGWTTLEKIREQTRELYRRVRQAVPNAACIVTSPMDAGIPTVGRKINVRKGSRDVGDIQRELAMEAGCAYWDMLAAAGGEGAISKWVDADLMLADLVHPRAKGADLLGHMFDLSLERTFLRRQANLPPNSPGNSGGKSKGSGASGSTLPASPPPPTGDGSEDGAGKKSPTRLGLAPVPPSSLTGRSPELAEMAVR